MGAPGNPDGALPGGDNLLPKTGYCDSAGWCWENPVPQGNDLNAVWATSATDVWAVGAGQTFLHLDGKLWSHVETGAGFSGSGLWGSGPSDLWAAGTFADGSKGLLRYDGTRWSPAASGLDFVTVKVWGSGPSDVWTIGGSASAIAHYDGNTWTKVTAVPPANMLDIWGNGPRDVWIAGSNGVILHYDGSAWTTTDTGGTHENLYSIAGTSSQDIVAVGASGVILHWDGKVWSRVQSPVASMLWRVSNVGGVLWIAGEGGVILRATGASWTRVKSGTDLLLSAIGGASASSLWAVGWEGVVMRYRPDLDEFVGGRNSGYTILYNLFVAAKDDLWVVGQADPMGLQMALLHSDGTSWSRVDPGGTAHYFSLWGSGGHDIWAVGQSADYKGVLAHYDGSLWTQSAVLPASVLSTLHGTASNNVWAVGQNGLVMHWDGMTWSSMNVGAGALGAVFVGSASDVWVGGEKGTLSHFDGSTWSAFPQAATTAVNAIRAFGKSDVWAVGEDLPGTGTAYGVILHYDGAGFTQTVPPIKYVSLYALYGVSATDIWAGGSGGYLTHYDGKGWSLGYQNTPTNREIRSLGGIGSLMWAVGWYGAIVRHTEQ